MRTALGLAVTVAILVGFPLLAITVGRRLPVPRPAHIRENPDWWLTRALGVSGADHRTIVEAVARGDRVEPRLRSAAVQYATRLAQDLDSQDPLRRHRWLVYVWVAVVAGGVIRLFFGHVNGLTLWEVFYLSAFPVLMVQVRRRQLRRVRRAIELNSDAPS